MEKAEIRNLIYEILEKNHNLTATEIQRLFIGKTQEWITIQKINGNVRIMIDEGRIKRQIVVDHKEKIPVEFLAPPSWREEVKAMGIYPYETSDALYYKALAENKDYAYVNIYKTIFNVIN